MVQQQLFENLPDVRAPGSWSKEEFEMLDRVLSGHAVSCSSSGRLHKRFREWAKSEGVYTPLVGELDVEFGICEHVIPDKEGVLLPFDFEHAPRSFQEHYFKEFYRPSFFREGGSFYLYVQNLRGRAIGSSWKEGFLSLADMIARLANEIGVVSKLYSWESFPGWSLDELRRRKQLEVGESVAIHCRGKHHKRLREWAREQGLYVYVGRPTQWGNSEKFEGEEARSLVCDEHWWELYHLRGVLFPPEKAHEDAIQEILPLRGKALACYCAPKRCHADNWAELVNSFPFAEQEVE